MIVETITEIWGDAKPVEAIVKEKGGIGPLLEVTRFRGPQLLDIETRVKDFLKENPHLNSDDAAASMTQKPKEMARMQDGLHILNQLSVIGRGAADINSVIVRQAANPGGKFPYYLYELDWKNPPAEKPASPAPKNEPAKTEKPEYPFKTAAQRDAERRLRPWQRSEGRIRKELEAQERRKQEEEIKAIVNVVIDTAREVVDQTIKNNYMKIEVGEDGVAVVSYKRSFGEFAVVNLKTGAYQDKIASLTFNERINPEYLGYINFLAQQAEGKDVTYSPKQLSPQEYQDIFERAKKTEMIEMTKSPNRRAVFCFRDNPRYIFSFPEEMDLERNVVPGSLNNQRPINPHFSNFLKSIGR